MCNTLSACAASSVLQRPIECTVASRPRVRPLSTRIGHSETLPAPAVRTPAQSRSEEHTSELQSLMRISYAVFCLKQKKPAAPHITSHPPTCSRPNSHQN